MMYPVFLDLAAKRCLVVGGGRVAVRKVLALLRAKASVVVVAKECCGRMRSLGSRVELHERPFLESDLAPGFFLVIGATDDAETNRAIARRAALLNIPCNIVDQPAHCSFIVPAQVRRGDVTIAVSTNGTAPRLTRYLKSAVAEAIGPVYGELAGYLGDVRKRIRPKMASIAVRNAFWEELFTVDPVTMLRDRGWEALRLRTERLIEDYSRKVAADEQK